LLLEIVCVICGIEEKSQKDVILAEKIAQEAINETHKTGSEVVSATLERAEFEIAHLMRVSDQKATEEAMKLAGSTANKLATMRARADRRLEAAAGLIVERIVNS